jgi:hypothetical protein
MKRFTNFVLPSFFAAIFFEVHHTINYNNFTFV